MKSLNMSLAFRIHVFEFRALSAIEGCTGPILCSMLSSGGGPPSRTSFSAVFTSSVTSLDDLIPTLPESSTSSTRNLKIWRWSRGRPHCRFEDVVLPDVQQINLALENVQRRPWELSGQGGSRVFDAFMAWDLTAAAVLNAFRTNFWVIINLLLVARWSNGCTIE